MSAKFNHARRQATSKLIAAFGKKADQLLSAAPDERTDEHAAYRTRHYERGFTTTSGQVALKMPKFKG